MMSTLYRNTPPRRIIHRLLSRRNLPHKQIWIVAPYVTPQLFSIRSPLGGMLFSQVEDGARVALVTAPPPDKELGWLEQLEARGITAYLYPRLHAKLYAFLLDEDRLDDPTLQGSTSISHLILIGSANFTEAGLGLATDGGNEELCYALPQADCDTVSTYVRLLVNGSFDLPSARVYKARNNWAQLEKPKWH
jgi:hypothetical protein